MHSMHSHDLNIKDIDVKHHENKRRGTKSYKLNTSLKIYIFRDLLKFSIDEESLI